MTDTAEPIDAAAAAASNEPFETKKRKPTGSKPTDIRSFSLTIPSLPAGPPSPHQPHTNPLPLCLALDIVQYADLTNSLHFQYTYTLLHPEESDLDPTMEPVFVKISADTSSPEDVKLALDHSFWYETKSPDAQEILKQLLELGILELIDPPRFYRPVGYSGEGEGLPLVRVKIPEKELAKRCKQCAIWEQRTDQERLASCSGCKKAWFCDDMCQAQSWKSGVPTPHKKLCKKLAALTAT